MLPHASVAINVLVCVRPQPELEILPLVVVTVGVPQASVAVAVPNARSMADAEGLHPSASELPEFEMNGAVTSTVHVTVRDAVDVVPQPSLAVQVLVWERPHPLFCMAPSFCVNVVAPQASLAVAVPKALVMSDAAGLQPNDKAVPPVVIIGGDVSSVQFAVRDAVDVFPQPSVASHVLVCDLLHPAL